MTPLAAEWLRLMRCSTTRAVGRECDYSLDPLTPDAFDPIGLLALATEGFASPDIWQSYPGEDGACIKRGDAEALASAAGFPPDRLYDLCLFNDEGWSWESMADFVEGVCR